MASSRVIWRGAGDYGSYEVVEETYNGRPARVLFSQGRRAAQSGIALDDKPAMLFDYNQRLLELAVSLEPASVLIIGGGTMTLPTALLRALPRAKLDVVELDPLLITLAEQYFDHKPNARLNIYTGDGRLFLDANRDRYDAIILDAYAELEIPKPLSTYEAVRAIRAGLADDGLFAANIVSPYYGRAAQVIHHHVAAYRQFFDVVNVYPAGPEDTGWQDDNLILAAFNQKLKATLNIRAEPFPPLDTSNDQPLYD